MLTITLAAVLGLLGVVAVVAYAHQANQRAVAGLKAETVLVAKFAIPAGTSRTRHRWASSWHRENADFILLKVSTRREEGDSD